MTGTVRAARHPSSSTVLTVIKAVTFYQELNFYSSLLFTLELYLLFVWPMAIP